MSISAKQQEYNTFLTMFKSNYYKGATLFKEMLNDSSQYPLLLANPCAMGAVFTHSARSDVDSLLINELLFDTTKYDTGLLSYLNALVDGAYTSFTDLFANASADSIIFINTDAPYAIRQSTAAITAMANSANAMSAVAASEVAMNQVLLYTTARRSIVRESSVAMNAIAASNMAITKLMADSTWLSEMSGSSVAVTAIGQNDIAISAAIASTTFMTNVINNATILAVILTLYLFVARIWESTTTMAIVRASANVSTFYAATETVLAQSIAVTIGESPSTYTSFAALRAVASVVLKIAASISCLARVMRSNYVNNMFASGWTTTDGTTDLYNAVVNALGTTDSEYFTYKRYTTISSSSYCYANADNDYSTTSRSATALTLCATNYSYYSSNHRTYTLQYGVNVSGYTSGSAIYTGGIYGKYASLYTYIWVVK